jgi:hypothetical protein
VCEGSDFLFRGVWEVIWRERIWELIDETRDLTDQGKAVSAEAFLSVAVCIVRRDMGAA